MPSLLRTPPVARPRRWVWAVPLCSAGFHAAVVGCVVLSSLFSAPKPKKPPTRPVTLKRIDSRQWLANRGAARFAQPVERPAPLHPTGQVVDVAPGNDQAPRDAKYLATTNNTVKQETRAREQVQKWSRATAKTTEHPEALPAQKGVTPESSPPPSGIDLAQSMLGKRLLPSALPQPEGGTTPDAAPRGPVGTESGEQKSGGDSTEGGGAPNDALDVAEGDSTALNTREWKYAGFFNRVKQAVSAKWDPNGRLRARNRSIATTRITVMAVTLKPDGSLADLYVAQSSGLDELDAEAMAAFERAAPFPNPPPALVEAGFIRFTFGFHVTNGNFSAPSPFRFR